MRTRRASWSSGSETPLIAARPSRKNSPASFGYLLVRTSAAFIRVSIPKTTGSDTASRRICAASTATCLSCALASGGWNRKRKASACSGMQPVYAVCRLFWCYDGGMRPILCLSLLLASGAWADQLDDRAAIEKTISTLNTTVVKRAAFTVDFNVAELTRLWPSSPFWRITPGSVVISHEPWGEAQWVPAAVLPPQAPLRLMIRSVRFSTPDVAIVDAVHEPNDTSSQRIPVVLVMKREGTDWRIASVQKAAPI
jgi:hypothetical protein